MPPPCTSLFLFPQTCESPHWVWIWGVGAALSSASWMVRVAEKRSRSHTSQSRAVLSFYHVAALHLLAHDFKRNSHACWPTPLAQLGVPCLSGALHAYLVIKKNYFEIELHLHCLKIGHQNLQEPAHPSQWHFLILGGATESHSWIWHCLSPLSRPLAQTLPRFLLPHTTTHLWLCGRLI
jgi:hypothetical protein